MNYCDLNFLNEKNLSECSKKWSILNINSFKRAIFIYFSSYNILQFTKFPKSPVQWSLVKWNLTVLNELLVGSKIKLFFKVRHNLCHIS